MPLVLRDREGRTRCRPGSQETCLSLFVLRADGVFRAIEGLFSSRDDVLGVVRGGGHPSTPVAYVPVFVRGYDVKTSYLILLPLLSCTAPAFAQTDQTVPTGAAAQSAAGLEEATKAGSDIVVTANRTATPIDRVGQSVTVIDTATIERRQAATVSDLLLQTPGVTVARNGGVGTTTSLSIRGAESDQTVALIDGVKLNDPSSPGGGFNFGTLLIGNIARIEVLRGAQSVLWGNQAIGGVVNLITRQAERPSGDQRTRRGRVARYRRRLCEHLGQDRSRLRQRRRGLLSDRWQFGLFRGQGAGRLPQFRCQRQRQHRAGGRSVGRSARFLFERPDRYRRLPAAQLYLRRYARICAGQAAGRLCRAERGAVRRTFPQSFQLCVYRYEAPQCRSRRHPDGHVRRQRQK